jgi:hypothetical protein
MPFTASSALSAFKMSLFVWNADRSVRNAFDRWPCVAPARYVPGPSQPGASVQEKPIRSFRQVLVRVMAMQVVTLALLGWLQYRYGR